jgi:hypothetical protein
MPWVRFDQDFDWSPRHGVTIAYKAGMVLNVTRGCAAAAKAAGRASAMVKTARDAEPIEDVTNG